MVRGPFFFFVLVYVFILVLVFVLSFFSSSSLSLSSHSLSPSPTTPFSFFTHLLSVFSLFILFHLPSARCAAQLAELRFVAMAERRVHLGRANPNRRRLRCGVCRQADRLDTVQCSHKRCASAFHVRCVVPENRAAARGDARYPRLFPDDKPFCAEHQVCRPGLVAWMGGDTPRAPPSRGGSRPMRVAGRTHAYTHRTKTLFTSST